MKIPKPRKLPSGSWFIQLRIDGQSISITEESEDLCVAKAMAIKTGLIKTKKKPAEITLGKAIDAYIDERKNILSPTTIKAYKSYRNHRFQDLMDKRISAISSRMIQTAISNELKAECHPSGENGCCDKNTPVSAKTVINAYGLMRTVLSLETDIDLSRITLPQKPVTGGKTLTPEQIGQLIKAVQGNEIELAVLLAVWLGLRRSEIAALQKSDFDFEHNTVTIHAALVQNEDNTWVEKGTKNSTSTRTLSCPEYIISRVKSLNDGRILSLHPNTLYRNLQKICERNNLPIVRFHDLRHCAASVMLLLGIPDKYAMERGGWASKQTMTGRYQHTIDSAAQAISNTIDNYYYGLLNDESKLENANACANA